MAARDAGVPTEDQADRTHQINDAFRSIIAILDMYPSSTWSLEEARVVRAKCSPFGDTLKSVSRGHGAVERAILANVNHVDSLLPLVFIARVAGYDPARQSVRHSFGRAARRLQARGLIDLYTVDVATATGLHGPTNYRAVLCACRPGLTAPDGHAAQTMGELAYRPVAG
jgi:hypothetical protein